MASAVFTAPFAVGTAVPSAEHLELQADPIQGAWAQFDAAEGVQLRRIGERGDVSVVALPAALRHRGTSFTPFADGWAIAIGRNYRGGSREETECRGYGGCEGSLIAAERSPAGRWTPVSTIPDSS